MMKQISLLKSLLNLPVYWVSVFISINNSSINQIKYTTEAVKARDALNGRYFAGRLVKAELYDQILYEDNDLSG